MLRGGIGTLTELTLTWSLLQTGQISPKPFILVGDHWRRLLEAFESETFMTERDFGLVTVVDSVDDALTVLTTTISPTP